MLNLYECTLAEASSPNPIADMTTVNAMKRELKSKLCTTSASYAYLQYRSKFSGMSITDNIVDIAVMVTDSARSALNIEHHLMISRIEGYGMG